MSDEKQYVYVFTVHKQVVGLVDDAEEIAVLAEGFFKAFMEMVRSIEGGMDSYQTYEHIFQKYNVGYLDIDNPENLDVWISSGLSGTHYHVVGARKMEIEDYPNRYRVEISEKEMKSLTKDALVTIIKASYHGIDLRKANNGSIDKFLKRYEAVKIEAGPIGT